MHNSKRSCESSGLHERDQLRRSRRAPGKDRSPRCEDPKSVKCIAFLAIPALMVNFDKNNEPCFDFASTSSQVPSSLLPKDLDFSKVYT